MSIDVKALYEALAKVLEQRENIKIKFYLEEVKHEENS